MYYRSGTSVRCGIGVLCSRCFVFTHQVTTLFYMKWHHHHLISVTSSWKSDSVNWSKFSWRNSCQISSNPIFLFELQALLKRLTQQKGHQQQAEQQCEIVPDSTFLIIWCSKFKTTASQCSLNLSPSVIFSKTDNALCYYLTPILLAVL